MINWLVWVLIIIWLFVILWFKFCNNSYESILMPMKIVDYDYET